MSDVDRLLESGTEEEKWLLASAVHRPLPPALKETVARAIEAGRAAPAGRVGSITWIALAGVLSAGLALAVGARSFTSRPQQIETDFAGDPPASWLRPAVQRPAAELTRPPGARTPASAVRQRVRRTAMTSERPVEHEPVPESSQPVEPAVPATEPPTAMPRVTLAASPPVTPQPSRPPAAPRPPPAAPAPGERITMAWGGRTDVVLDVRTVGRVVQLAGVVRGLHVDFKIDGPVLTGHIADELVQFTIHQGDANGTLLGSELSLSMSPTERGMIIRGQLPGHQARVALEPTWISWFPGCAAELPATAAAAFEGQCKDGRVARMTLPVRFQSLPPVALMVVLALVLPERDPIFQYERPSLWPPLPGSGKFQ